MKLDLWMVIGALAVTAGSAWADTADLWAPDALPSTVTGMAGDTQRLFDGTCQTWQMSARQRQQAEQAAEENALHRCQGTAVERTSDWDYHQECWSNIYIRWQLHASFQCLERQDVKVLGGAAAGGLSALIGTDKPTQVLCLETFKEVVVNGVLTNYRDLDQCTLRDEAGERTLTDEQANDGQTWLKQEGAAKLFEALPVYGQSRIDPWIYRRLATVTCRAGQCEVRGRINPQL